MNLVTRTGAARVTLWLVGALVAFCSAVSCGSTEETGSNVPLGRAGAGGDVDTGGSGGDLTGAAGTNIENAGGRSGAGEVAGGGGVRDAGAGAADAGQPPTVACPMAAPAPGSMFKPSCPNPAVCVYPKDVCVQCVHHYIDEHNPAFDTWETCSNQGPLTCPTAEPAIAADCPTRCSLPDSGCRISELRLQPMLLLHSYSFWGGVRLVGSVRVSLVPATRPARPALLSLTWPPRLRS